MPPDELMTAADVLSGADNGRVRIELDGLSLTDETYRTNDLASLENPLEALVEHEAVGNLDGHVTGLGKRRRSFSTVRMPRRYFAQLNQSYAAILNARERQSRFFRARPSDSFH